MDILIAIYCRSVSARTTWSGFYYDYYYTQCVGGWYTDGQLCMDDGLGILSLPLHQPRMNKLMCN